MHVCILSGMACGCDEKLLAKSLYYMDDFDLLFLDDSPHEEYDITYTDVMKEAMSLASKVDGVINDEILLHALLIIHPESLEEILGCKCVRPPFLHNSDFPADSVRISPTVHRMLSVYGGEMSELCEDQPLPWRLSSFHIACVLLTHNPPAVRDFLHLNAIDASQSVLKKRIKKLFSNRRKVNEVKKLVRERHHMLNQLRMIRHRLLDVCCGQDEAITGIVNRLGRFWSTPACSRNARPMTICLVGQNGTGKTHICTQLIQIIEDSMQIEAIEPVDMGGFSGAQLAIDLAGRDEVWHGGGHPGILTERAKNSPRGIILLEGLDKAHQDALAYVDTVISTGLLEDNYTKKKISFAQNIIIYTLSLPCRQEGRFASMSEDKAGSVPHDKMVELVMDTLQNMPGSTTSDRNVLGNMRSLLDKTDDIILLNDHDVASTRHMIRLALDKAIEQHRLSYDVLCNKEKLEVFFLECMQKIGSANNITPLVMEALHDRLMHFFINNATPEEYMPDTLEISLDELPELPDDNTTSEPYSDEWVEERTVLRCRKARRLKFDTIFTRNANKLCLHFTNLRHIVLPSIEDADFFSVRLPDVQRRDLVGMDTPWRIVMRALEHINAGHRPGITPQYGVLLCGPPGTGKTSFAKAVAAELNMPFIYVSTADLCCGNPSVGVKRVHQLFAAAHRTGAIIFMDEIDALGSRDSSHGMYDIVINSLLTELDGFNERRVLVIAATNRPELLDPALTRNGRLHTRVHLGSLKNDADRAALISAFCEAAAMPIPQEVLDFAVTSTYDWTPANLKALLSHAIEFASSAGREISRRDIVAALHKEYFGEDTQKIALSEDELRHVAIHESGHALACTLLGMEWVQVTLHSGGSALGYLESLEMASGGCSAQALRNRIEVSLAGRVAEELLSEPMEGSSSDFAQARAFAERIIDERLEPNIPYVGLSKPSRKREAAVERIVSSCANSVRARLASHRACLEQVVEQLLHHRVLLQSDVAEIIRNSAHDSTSSSGQTHELV